MSRREPLLVKKTPSIKRSPAKRSPRRLTRADAASARQFIAQAKLPRARRATALAAAVEPAFDEIKNQAAVVGSELVSFVRGVTAERREAIVHSSLLAQLVAKREVPDASRVADWYRAYFDALMQIGWVIQDRSFAEYHEESDNLEAHKAILAVAGTFLGGAAPGAIALVTSTLNALKTMNENSPWITLFSRESQTGRTAHFQVSLAEENEAGQFLVHLMAFAMTATLTITQVLFFKFRTSDVTLRKHSGRVTIDAAVLEAVQGALKAKLARHASEYIKRLPDFD